MESADLCFLAALRPASRHLQTNLVVVNRLSISPLFQSRSFTYRTAENTYEQDPYAGFLIPPEQALAESIRASMRASGVFGRSYRQAAISRRAW